MHEFPFMVNARGLHIREELDIYKRLPTGKTMSTTSQLINRAKSTSTPMIEKNNERTSIGTRVNYRYCESKYASADSSTNPILSFIYLINIRL
ncbi:unnamed protein product [Adineta ricciae]|uniref:Uncharacterized protein n=1 Tax=Adineta ricciae TaxID=249248 RepID=A0A815LCX9_ADIRI|nr:unnamed protein product [Adineta ricciae]